MNQILAQMIAKYELAQGSKIDPNRIILGDLGEASYTCHKALESLEYDETGTLAILLMLKAWEDYKSGKTYGVREIVDHPEYIDNIKDTEYYFTQGEPADVFAAAMQQAKDVCSRFDISIGNINDDVGGFVEIFEEAYENIYKKYRVEKFLCSDTKNNQPNIMAYEYTFNSLPEFVNCLKNSDNCVVYAKINAAFDYEDTNEYDAFFAFGCRCGDHVYINSDRRVYATPESRSMCQSRNPGKELAHKADGTWMPYYFIANGGKTEKQTALVKIDCDVVPKRKISELYDEGARTIIALSIYAIYKKYFKDGIREEKWHGKPVKDSYFSTEIKLIPATNTTALALPGEYQLPALSIADSRKTKYEMFEENFEYDGKDYYDNLITTYLTDQNINECSGLPSGAFVGDEDTIKQLVWWSQRRNMAEIISERIANNVSADFWSAKHPGESYKCVKTCNDWTHTRGGSFSWDSIEEELPTYNYLKNVDFVELIAKNYINIIKIALMLEQDGSPRCVVNGEKIKDFKAHDYIFDDENSKNIDISTFHYSSKDKPLTSFYNIDFWDKRISDDHEACIYYINKNSRHGCCRNEIIIAPTKYQTKAYLYEITPKNAFDLAKLLGIDRTELPKSLQHWLSCRYCQTPQYSGNRLLDVTDYMSNVYDVVNSQFRFKIVIGLSKAEYKYYKDMFGIVGDRREAEDW